jgi:3-phytase
MTRRASAAVAAAVLLAVAMPAAWAEEPRLGSVTAVRETEPVDVDPDDPAIWINTDDPALSRVIGTDKDYGLVVFDLEGRIVQRLADGRLNNVDLRSGVTLGGRTVTIVAATKREDNTIVFYTIGADGVLERAEPWSFPGSPEPVEDDIYGVGLFHDPAGALSVVASFKSGEVVQWRIGGPAEALSLSFARAFRMPSQPEGVAADDALGLLYVGEEDGGVWRYDARPDAAVEPVLVDRVGSACLPVDDVEGIAIYPAGPDNGYLVVSAQGVNRYAVYPRRPLADGSQPCLGSFSIDTGATDPVGETDGIDVTATPLGPDYPEGLLVVQDDRNEGFSRNFKYVSWAKVRAALQLT